MPKRRANAERAESKPVKILDTALLALCLCILALRVTYTESPTAQVFTTMPNGLTDTIYSLTLSGLLVFAFISWLAVRLCGRGFTYHVIGVEFGLVLFAVAAAIATANASDKRAGITQTMVLLGPVAAALLLAQILRSDVWMRLTLAVVVALGIVSTYQAAEQFFLSNRIMVEQYEQDPNMLLGPLGIDPGTFQHLSLIHI